MNTPIPPSLTTYHVQQGMRLRLYVVFRDKSVPDDAAMSALIKMGLDDLYYWNTSPLPVDWPAESPRAISSDERVVRAEGTWRYNFDMPTAITINAQSSAIFFQVWAYSPDDTARVVVPSIEFPDVGLAVSSGVSSAGSFLDSQAYAAFQEAGRALSVPPEWVMLLAYLESRFKTNAGAGSKYVGLNQLNVAYLPAGISASDYVTWPASRQMREVVTPWLVSTWKAYFDGKPMGSPGVLYALNIAPGRLRFGAGPDAVMYRAPSREYTQNANLDTDQSGTITIADFNRFMDRLSRESAFRREAEKLPSAASPLGDDGGSGWKIAGLAALVAGVAGGVYWIRNRKRRPRR